MKRSIRWRDAGDHDVQKSDRCKYFSVNGNGEAIIAGV